MADVTDLAAYREAHTPHLRGEARCLHCGHTHASVSPVGVYAGLECPQCGLDKGVLQGIVLPTTRWVCDCGCDVYFILPGGCQCVQCGVLAKGL